MCTPMCGEPAHLMGPSACMLTPQVFSFDAIVQVSRKISAFDCQLQLPAYPRVRRASTSVHGHGLPGQIGRTASRQLAAHWALLSSVGLPPKLLASAPRPAQQAQRARPPAFLNLSRIQPREKRLFHTGLSECADGPGGRSRKNFDPSLSWCVCVVGGSMCQSSCSPYE